MTKKLLQAKARDRRTVDKLVKQINRARKALRG